MKSYVAPETLQRVFKVVEHCAATGRLRPYMVIEKESPEWPRRQAPSLPRPLTREELER